MISALAARLRRPDFGHWIPWAFAAGMLLVVLVNGALIYFALSTWSGVSTSRAYERGIAYNQVLAAAARQDALGWQLDLAHQPAGGGAGAGQVVLTWRDRDGRALGDLGIRATLLRPLEAAPAIELPVRALGGGRYAGALDAPLRAGQWDVQISASRGADEVHLTQRLVVR